MEGPILIARTPGLREFAQFPMMWVLWAENRPTTSYCQGWANDIVERIVRSHAWGKYMLYSMRCDLNRDFIFISVQNVTYDFHSWRKWYILHRSWWTLEGIPSTSLKSYITGIGRHWLWIRSWLCLHALWPRSYDYIGWSSSGHPQLCDKLSFVLHKWYQSHHLITCFWPLIVAYSCATLA